MKPLIPAIPLTDHFTDIAKDSKACDDPLLKDWIGGSRLYKSLSPNPRTHFITNPRNAVGLLTTHDQHVFAYNNDRYTVFSFSRRVCS